MAGIHNLHAWSHDHGPVTDHRQCRLSRHYGCFWNRARKSAMALFGFFCSDDGGDVTSSLARVHFWRTGNLHHIALRISYRRWHVRIGSKCGDIECRPPAARPHRRHHSTAGDGDLLQSLSTRAARQCDGFFLDGYRLCSRHGTDPRRFCD